MQVKGTLLYPKAAFAAAVLVSCVVPATLASGAAGAVHLSKKPPLVQQGLDFYRGKTITQIVPSAVGGQYDSTARAIDPFLANYLGATINIENISNGTIAAGENQMAASKPDGLTIGELDATSVADAIVTKGASGQAVNFNASRLTFIGATGGAPFQFTCLSTSPYTNFSQIIKASEPVKEVTQLSGAAFTYEKMLNAAFGIKAQIITGYSNTAAQEAGFFRGDGDCISQGISALGSYIQAGKARILVQTRRYNPATAYASLTTHVPLISTFEKKYPPKTPKAKKAMAAFNLLTGPSAVGIDFTGPHGISPARAAALQWAFQMAMKNVHCEDTLLSHSQSIGWVTPTRERNAYLAVVSALKPEASLILAS